MKNKNLKSELNGIKVEVNNLKSESNGIKVEANPEI